MTYLPEQGSPSGEDTVPPASPALWRIPAFRGTTPDLNGKIDALRDRLIDISQRHERATLASSLSVEDMLISDLVWRDLGNLASHLPVITLDTGALHPETLEVLAAITQRYGQGVLTVWRPDEDAVAAYLTANGPRAYYDSVTQRKACCHLRKVEPLNRALATSDAWITGQRRDQSSTRSHLDLVEWDAGRGIAKYNPLADWAEDEVWAAVKLRDVPTNRLYQRGYPSIGCAPCSAPVKAGADVRSGRWWWENRTTKECGLHLVATP